MGQIYWAQNKMRPDALFPSLWNWDDDDWWETSNPKYSSNIKNIMKMFQGKKEYHESAIILTFCIHSELLWIL